GVAFPTTGVATGGRGQAAACIVAHVLAHIHVASHISRVAPPSLAYPRRSPSLSQCRQQPPLPRQLLLLPFRRPQRRRARCRRSTSSGCHSPRTVPSSARRGSSSPRSTC